MRSAALAGANLTYANLTYADLVGADLTDIDLRGAMGCDTVRPQPIICPPDP